MGLCFICDEKLYGERTRVCSSITQHGNVPFPEKIAEIMGEDFLIVVTPADHLCKKCTSLLTHMDKLENELKAVKNTLLTCIQKKYGIIPADQPVKTFDMPNGNVRKDDLETSQKRVPSGLTVRDNSANSSLKMSKAHQQETSKMKIYKCGFCTFQSKELGHVRFHMRSHMNKKVDGEKTAQSGHKLLAPAPPQQQQKKRLYRCQVCSMSFDSRQICLDHIQKDHSQQTVKEGIRSETSKGLAVENHRAGVSTKNVGDRQQDKGAVETDILLNNDVPAEGSQQQETLMTDGLVSAQVDAIQNDQGTNIEKGAEDMAIGGEEGMTMGGEDGGITIGGEDGGIAIGGEEDMAIGGEDNKTGDLDIESMLAAIHHDTSHTDVGDEHNVI